MCYDCDKGQTPATQPGMVGNSAPAPNPYPPQHYLADLHDKSVHHHYEEAEKNGRAARFFRDNPAFDEFIRLVREGVVQI